jgi:MFS transporter, OPA family, solute carrier family 37 (glycerol-3-phosphate transporter), member 1/2
VSFLAALNIPGVLAYALCLFFSKLVAYVFLYWLPFYLGTTPIGGAILQPKQAGRFSALFDIGGIFGGVVAGLLSDVTGASASVASAFLLCTIPSVYMFRSLGGVSLQTSGALMLLSGFLVNGPYALIATAVSADLGSHDSLQGNERALATVTAIIDGFGSIGAAVGPTLAGFFAESGRGFDDTFGMLYAAEFLAFVMLIKLVAREVWGYLRPPLVHPCVELSTSSA